MPLLPEAIKLAVGAALMALFGYFVILPIERQAGVVQGMEIGAVAERGVWEKKVRDAEAEQARARVVAQAAIDAIEREYLQRDKARVLKMTALKKALEEEQADEPTSAGAPCACRSGVSRGVRDAIQNIGRSPARANPAKPDTSVRRSR